MDLALRSKVVLIAGASGVLGAASARLFAAEGATLALLGRNRDRLEPLIEECRAIAGRERVEGFEADLGNARATAAACEAACARFGRLDVVVAAAGAAQGGVFWQIDDEAWQRNLEAKLFGTIRLLRAVIPGLIERRAGRIVVIVGSSAKMPEARMLPGAAANAALLAIVRGLAIELGVHGIAINAVNPGPVRSPRWDTMMSAAAAAAGITAAESERPFLEGSALKRLATPEDVAQHVVFLASERAAHLTGTSVTVDGGATRSP
jgi:NAD(P)-dependent dehydrogenase (short-subunit alcohol dehydrogenase family)